MIGSLALALAAMAMQPLGVESLDWMSGHWRTRSGPMPRSGPHWSEEVWTGAHEYLMVGASRTQRGFGFRSFNHMRIEEDDGVVTLHIWSMDGSGGAYRLSRLGDQEAVFENSGSRASITYRREGDALIAIYSGIDGSQPARRHYIRCRSSRVKRASLPPSRRGRSDPCR